MLRAEDGKVFAQPMPRLLHRAKSKGALWRPIPARPKRNNPVLRIHTLFVARGNSANGEASMSIFYFSKMSLSGARASTKPPSRYRKSWRSDPLARYLLSPCRLARSPVVRGFTVSLTNGTIPAPETVNSGQ
jgi:hypothetical protein